MEGNIGESDQGHAGETSELSEAQREESQADIVQEEEEASPSETADSDNEDANSSAAEDDTPKDWKYYLQEEIKAGDFEKVEAILDDENNENALELRFSYDFYIPSDELEGVTPLILASGLGQIDIVKSLLKRGADIRATTTNKNYQPFVLACQKGHLEVVKALLDHRKSEGRKGEEKQKEPEDEKERDKGEEKEEENPEQKEKPLDFLEWRVGGDATPLILAAWFGHGDVVDYLISEGADVTAYDSDEHTGLHHAAWEGYLGPVTSILEKEPSLLDKKSKLGDTAFLLTTRKGEIETAEFLLEKGASLTVRDSGEANIVHNAAWHGQLEMLDKFLTLRPQFLEERDTVGRTPFIRACWQGHLDIVKYLMMVGANILHITDVGETGFQAAAAEGHLDVVMKLYDSHPDFLEMKKNDGQTALLLAVLCKKSEVMEYLLDQKADLHARDAEGENVLNNAVFAGTEDEASLERLRALLDKGARLEPNNSGRNAVHIAAYAGKEKYVRMLFDELSKETESDRMPSHHYTAKDDWGDTPLTDAISQEYVSVVLAILESTLFFPLAPARDEAYICSEKEIEEASKLFLDLLKPTSEDLKPESPDVEEKPSPESHSTEENPEDEENPNAAEEATQEASNEDVSSDSDEKKEEDKKETRAEKIELLEQKLKIVLYWAVQNGNPELAEICIQKQPDLAFLNRGGASWLHVAAIGGNSLIMDHLLEKRVHDQEKLVNRLLEQHLIKSAPAVLKRRLPTADKGVTPFHLAVRYSNLETVEKLLFWVDDEPQEEEFSPQGTNFPLNINQTRPGVTNVLDTILQMTEDGDSPVSLAASGNTGTHRDIEEILWKRLDRNIMSNPWFFSHPLAEEAERVLELAAQFETPREESFLRLFLQRMPHRIGIEKAKDLNTLQLAVYHQCPTVVWWLLSNGGYMNENDMQAALRLSSRVQTDPFGAIIHELLTDPPPVLKSRARRDDHRPPTFQFSRQEYDSPDGTVLDFYCEDHQVTFQIKRRPLHNIIYQDGPQKIMSATQYRNLASLKTVVSGLDRTVDVKSKTKAKELKTGPEHDGSHLDKPSADSAGARKPTGGAEDAKKADSSGMAKQKLPDLRWIHLPVNNLRCVEELMVRLSLDKDIKNKEHRELSHFVRKSWAQLPAGSRRSYMKPQCVYDDRRGDKSPDDTEGENSENPDSQQTEAKSPGKRVALYMPYIFWTRWPLALPGRSDHDLSQSETQLTQRGPLIHESLTLDQYYYVSLKDTTKRDSDQVLWRFMEVEKQKLRAAEFEQRPFYRQNTMTKHDQHVNDSKSKWLEDQIEQDVGATHILIVNQLWLWILDDKTIITTTSAEPEGLEASFFQRVLNIIRNQDRNSLLSVEHVTELILSTATGMFNKKEIKFGELKKSPLDVYRESILNVRDAEADLFDRFRESLKSAQPTKSRSRSLSRAETSSAQTSASAKWNYQDGPNGSIHSSRRRYRLSHFIETEPKEVQIETQEVEPPQTESMRDKVKNWWHQKVDSSHNEGNPYHDIAREAELLREVKDISDELNMLKNLAEDQEGVWKQFWVEGTAPRTTYTYDTPSEIRGEIEEMIKEAEFVQQAIDTLLDLKQKQANITEAQYTRKQSDDTATQSDTVMVFTVVTILFLPASFLTSLFALNISDFPHKGDNVSYEGYWIYPIIFGVSIFVSGFFAIIAFNASAVKRYWAKKKKNQPPHLNRHVKESRQVDKKLVALNGSSGGDTIV